MSKRVALAERGLVDDVIDPAEARIAVARGLAMVRTKREHRLRVASTATRHCRNRPPTGGAS